MPFVPGLPDRQAAGADQTSRTIRSGSRTRCRRRWRRRGGRCRRWCGCPTRSRCRSPPPPGGRAAARTDHGVPVGCDGAASASARVVGSGSSCTNRRGVCAKTLTEAADSIKPPDVVARPWRRRRSPRCACRPGRNRGPMRRVKRQSAKIVAPEKVRDPRDVRSVGRDDDVGPGAVSPAAVSSASRCRGRRRTPNWPSSRSSSMHEIADAGRTQLGRGAWPAAPAPRR